MSDLKTEIELLQEYLTSANLTLNELVERAALTPIIQAMKAYHLQFEKQINNDVEVCVNCDRKKETHNICIDCLIKIINENKQTD